jgi:hypothetical protein
MWYQVIPTQSSSRYFILSLFEALFVFIQRIQIEIGCRSLKEPFSPRTFGTFISETFSNRPFADKPITIPVVNPERTFLEKIFLLHEEFQKEPDKIRVQRLSRHLYDIEKLMHSTYAEIALADKDLIRL